MKTTFEISKVVFLFFTPSLCFSSRVLPLQQGNICLENHALFLSISEEQQIFDLQGGKKQKVIIL